MVFQYKAFILNVLFFNVFLHFGGPFSRYSIDPNVIVLRERMASYIPKSSQNPALHDPSCYSRQCPHNPRLYC